MFTHLCTGCAKLIMQCARLNVQIIMFKIEAPCGVRDEDLRRR